MKYVLLFHIVVEILGGFLLILNPELLMMSEPMNITLASVIKLFGVAVLLIGLVSLLIYRNFDYSDKDRLAVLAFMGYHMAQGLQCWSMNTHGTMTSNGAFLLHISIAILFLVVFMKEREKFPERNPS